ncbi:MAG TPA: hypothetical protein VLX92_21680 [Kofleriaceae bacterium]|nr:hypothetical protein [Kofleriaceae bacterium]
MTTVRTFALVLVTLAGCMMPGQGQTAAYPAASGGGAPSGGGGSDPAMAASSGGGGAPAAPAGPTVVDVELHNDCSNEVKLFLGDKPGFGSGTSTSLGSNTTTSYQMKPGDMIWIIDDSEHGLASTTIGGGSSRTHISITSGCTGFGQ